MGQAKRRRQQFDQRRAAFIAANAQTPEEWLRSVDPTTSSDLNADYALEREAYACLLPERHPDHPMNPTPGRWHTPGR